MQNVGQETGRGQRTDTIAAVPRKGSAVLPTDTGCRIAVDTGVAEGGLDQFQTEGTDSEGSLALGMSSVEGYVEILLDVLLA